VYHKNYLEIIWTIPLSSSYQGSTFLIFSLCLNFFHLLALKPNLEEKKTFIQTNSFVVGEMGGIWVIRVQAISGFNSTYMYQCRDKTFYHDCYSVI
jgi:hypothetical protein